MLMFGLTSVTFRALSWQRIIELTLENGLTGIEWGGDVHVPPDDLGLAAQVGEATRAAGLRVFSYGSYFRLGQELQEFQKVSAAASALGTDMIRIWAGEQGSAQTDEAGLEALVKSLRSVCAVAREAGQTVSMEFHKNTYNDTAESGLRLLEAAGCGNAKTYWQPIRDSGTELRNIERMSSVITNIHMFHWKENGKRYPLKKGPVWQEYAKAIRALPGDHGVLFEFVKHDSPRQLKKDVAAMKRWFSLESC